MKAKIITRYDNSPLREKTFVYILYGSKEYDAYIAKAEDDIVEFILEVQLKPEKESEIYIIKSGQKIVKLKII